MATLETPMVGITFVNEANPTSNFAYLSYLRIGDANNTTNNTNYIYAYAPFWRYHGGELHDLIPAGARIDSVVLRLYHTSKDWVGETSAASNIRLATQAPSGDETNLTWDNKDTRFPVDQNNIIDSFTRYSSDANGYHDYTLDGLKAHLQTVLDTNADFHGFRISSSDISPASDKNASNYATAFYGDGTNYPRLIITYTPDTMPTVTCSAATNVDHDGATMNGEVVSDGGSTILDTYFELSTHNTFDNWYEPSEYFTVDVSDTVGVKSANVALPAGTSFYYRLVCRNAVGTATSTPLRLLTTKTIVSAHGVGGAGKSNSITGAAVTYGKGGDGAVKTDDVGVAGTANTGAGGSGGGASKAGGAGGSGLTVIRYKTEDAISAQYVTDAKAFNPSIAFQRGKLFTPYYASGSKVTVNVSTIGSGTSPVITCADAITGLVDGMGVTIVNSGSAAINGNWIVSNVNQGAKTFTITPGTTVVGNSPTGCLATFNAYVGIQDTADTLAPIGWLKTSRSAMEMLTIKKKFKYISVIHEPFEADEYVGCGWTLDGTEAIGVPDIQSPTETIFPIHGEGYSIDVTLSLVADSQLSISPKVTAVHVVWSFVKNKVHQYSLLCVKGANGGRWNKNPKKAIQFLFANAGDVLTFEERFAGTYQGTIDAVDFNQGQQSLSDDASGLVRLTVVEET